jgi:hypothetical protein
MDEPAGGGEIGEASMGLVINIATLLRQVLARHNATGPLIALGVQATPFSRWDYADATGDARDGPNAPMSDRELYRSWGFAECVNLDISDYEGADISFDLNSEYLPERLTGKFGAVLNGGTMEHVFHVPNCLTNMTRMLAPIGYVIHITPLHNWVDHGFYQFGPTLLFDYYDAAGFEILESAACFFHPGATEWSVLPAPLGTFGTGGCGALDGRAALHVFLAKRNGHVIEKPIPIQSLYAAHQRRPKNSRWFPPLTISGGRIIDTEEPEVLSVRSFEPENGFAWRCALPELSERADTSEYPVRSRLALFEDDLLLGPPHSAHQNIRTLGYGRYSHWGTNLYFSTSDASDPNRNGRRYTVKCP